MGRTNYVLKIIIFRVVIDIDFYSPKSLYVVAMSPVPHHFVPGMMPLNNANGLLLN